MSRQFFGVDPRASPADPPLGEGRPRYGCFPTYIALAVVDAAARSVGT
ncbi:hypothetical protein [Streptomyces sp. NPDC005969]